MTEVQETIWKTHIEWALEEDIDYNRNSRNYLTTQEKLLQTCLVWMINLPKEGVVRKNTINNIREIKIILENDIYELVQETSYDKFIGKLLKKLQHLKENNCSQKSKNEFLKIVTYQWNFSHIWDKLFYILSWKSTDEYIIEELWLKFHTW